MKIIVSITDGKKTYSEDVTEDQKEYIDSLEINEVKASLTTFSHLYQRELKPFPFTTTEISKYNTDDENCHFIFGWAESFSQGDDIPGWMFNMDELFISVNHELSDRQIQQNEKEEQIYTNGETQALKNMIVYCQNQLRGFGIELKTKDEFDQERIDVIATLRTCCGEHGDNDWDDNLHLSDIIYKHLIRYIEEL